MTLINFSYHALYLNVVFEGEKPHEASVEECRQCTNQAREIEEREEMYRQEMQNVKDEYEAKIHRLSANLQAEVKERECQRISFQKELAGVNDKHQQALKELNALKEKCSTASNRCGGSIAQAFSGIAQGGYIYFQTKNRIYETTMY
jgi:hypothetical protein